HQHLLDITNYWVGLPQDSPAELDLIPALGEISVSETAVSYKRTHPPAELVDWEVQATGLDPSREYSHQDSGTFVSPGLQYSTWNIDAVDFTYEHLIIRAFTPLANNRTRVFWICEHNYGEQRPNAMHVLRAVMADSGVQDSAMVKRFRQTSAQIA